MRVVEANWLNIGTDNQYSYPWSNTSIKESRVAQVTNNKQIDTQTDRQKDKDRQLKWQPDRLNLNLPMEENNCLDWSNAPCGFLLRNSPCPPEARMTPAQSRLPHDIILVRKAHCFLVVGSNGALSGPLCMGETYKNQK